MGPDSSDMLRASLLTRDNLLQHHDDHGEVAILCLQLIISMAFELYANTVLSIDIIHFVSEWCMLLFMLLTATVQMALRWLHIRYKPLSSYSHLLVGRGAGVSYPLDSQLSFQYTNALGACLCRYMAPV